MKIKKTPLQNPCQVRYSMKINKNSIAKPMPISLNEFVELNTNKIAYLAAKVEYKTKKPIDMDYLIQREYYKYCRKLHLKTRAKCPKTKK
jgi:hypothetical protein